VGGRRGTQQPGIERELAGTVATGRLAGARGAPVVPGGGTPAGRSVWRRVLTRKAQVEVPNSSGLVPIWS